MFTSFRAPAVAAFAIMTSLTAGSASAQELSAPGRPSIQLQQKVATTFIVKFDESVDPTTYRRNAASIATRFRGRVVHTYETVLPGFAMRIDGSDGANLLAAVGQFGIASVDRDAIVSISANGPEGPGANAPTKCGFPFLPCEDPEDTTGTTPPPPPDQPEQSVGWNIDRVLGTGATLGDYSVSAFTSITACVIDTGIMSGHPDLNVVSGWNVITGTDNAEDDNGHGTHVAGIIGAKANAIGVVGVAPGIRVVPIKVLDARGSGSLADVIDGVDWAVDNCTVANLSLGGTDSTTLLDEAIQAAAGGVKFSIAAGNSTMDIESGKGSGYTPARASTGTADEIFTIASIADGDVWSSYSNFHSAGSSGGRVDFALPGQSIRSTWNDGLYKTISGTSMAAPHMAGLLVRYIAARLAEPDPRIEDADILGTSTVSVDRAGKGNKTAESYNIIGPVASGG